MCHFVNRTIISQPFSYGSKLSCSWHIKERELDKSSEHGMTSSIFMFMCPSMTAMKVIYNSLVEDYCCRSFLHPVVNSCFV